MRGADVGALETLVGVLEQSMDMHLITDGNGVVEYANPVFESVTGFSRREMVGKKPAIFMEELCPDGFYSAVWGMLRAGKVFRGVLANRKRSGEIFYDETTISPIRDGGGIVRHFMLTCRDVTRNVDELTRLQLLANFDELTSLPNRHLLMDRLQHALSHASRERKELAVIFLDLDDFKCVNDVYGHACGDELLREVAMRLKNCIRQEDTVARLGGDEFVIVLAEVAGDDGVLAVLEKITTSLRRYSSAGEKPLAASCSIGVSIYPHDGKTPSKLLRCADIAMYRAKVKGGGRYGFYCRREVKKNFGGYFVEPGEHPSAYGIGMSGTG